MPSAICSTGPMLAAHGSSAKHAKHASADHAIVPAINLAATRL
jgi:hypothetical protein